MDDDYALREVARVARLLGTDRVRVEGVGELNDTLWNLRKARYPQNAEIGPREANQFLKEVVEVASKTIQRHAGNYSWHKWLWFLRRLPHEVFRFKTMSTPDYDRAIAETAVGVYANSPNSLPDFYEIQPTTIRRVLRFCGMAIHLSDAFGALQWAGAGASFRFGDLPLPDPIPSDLDAAVQLYLARLPSERPMFARLGIPTSLDPLTKGAPIIAPLFLEPDGPQVVNLRDKRFTFNVTLTARYHALFISVADIVEFLSDLRLRDAQFAVSIGALLLLQRVVLAIAFGHQAYAVQMHLFGFYHVRTSDFVMACDVVCSDWHDLLASLPHSIPVPQSGDELIAALQQIVPMLEPLRCGPIICVSGDHVAIDLAAASQRLYSDLEAPVGAGDPANYRAAYFETALQDLIDRTSKRPMSECRALRGRTLVLQGNAITDVDAIAEIESAILLISCKSIPYSARYDSGDHAAVRNVQTKVTDEVSKHRATIARLNANPRGDNYDFKKQLVGVVCTPHVVLLPIGDATVETQPGLRMASSLSELLAWCRHVD